MNVIDQRKAAIQRTLAEAETTRSDAQTLQHQYENRVTEWEQEREKARGQLRDEIRVERNRLLEDLRAELDQEREKAAAVEQRRLKDFAQQAEVSAIALGGTFVSRLLSRLGGPELEGKIIDMVTQDLSTCRQPNADDRGASATTGLPMKITSAYPLDTARREVLFHAFERWWDAMSPVNSLKTGISSLAYRSVPDLGARANVQDEMTFFAASSRHA